MMFINPAIELLKSYNGPSKLTLHSGASETLISTVESAYNTTLPDDFKTFYRFTDGFEVNEDIFNMIALKEMIENRDVRQPLWIAEYMIYSDMWCLEISSDDCNDYSIFNIGADGKKIILTNSLGEFIARFLNGGVFETGGLYYWAR
ncbi:MAG: SMI1/KNR4 family protein [Mucilaginibacter sp.]